MRRIAALLLPLALTACVGPYYGGGYPGGGRYERHDRWGDYAGLPLAARLTQAGGSVGVRLNRPAYVAVFEIVPGRGVGLMYPSYSRERSYLPAGFSYLNMTAPRYYDWYDTGVRGRYLSAEPRYYFLVASRRPLRISRFQRSPGALRSVLGVNAYSALNYHTVMNDLVYAVVPPQPDDDWTTDLLAIYPDRFYDRYAYGGYYDNQRYVRVRCPDGSIQVVPWELVQYACRGGRGSVVPPLRPTDPDGRDSAVSKPTRRRPQPPTAGGTGETGGSGRLGAPGRRPRAPGEATGDGDTRLRPEGNQPRALPPRVRPDSAQPDGLDPRRPDQPLLQPRLPAPREKPESDEPRKEPRRLDPPQRVRDEPGRAEPQPRVREEPRRAEPQPRVREEPREAPRRAEPRSEPPPRSEPARSESPPRAEPARSDPPPRSDPPRADRPSDSRPSPVRPSRDPSAE